MQLKHLTDKQLLADTKHLAREDKKLTARLLHHIQEIERRKLFSELGYSSLFSYVVEELGYSEASASRRISAARLLKTIPEIEEKIVNGDLTLSNLSKASEKFRQEGITDSKFQKDILSAIENTSTRNCEKTLTEIITPSTLPMYESVQTYHSLAINNENYQIFEKIRGLMAHKKFSKDQIWEKILTCALKQIEFEKFKLNTSSTNELSHSRYIPSAVKKAVYERDKSCKKCGSTFALQFDHITPYSHGGKTEIANLRLLCRNCNQRSRISARLKG